MAQIGSIMHENDVSYKGYHTFQCPSGSYWCNQYKITNAATKWNPSDEQIMMHVMENGATAVGLYADDISDYEMGIHDDCS